MPAVFVLPTTTAGQFGPVAAYLSTAGWAAAAQRLLGASWIVCPTGTITPAEARRRGTDPALRSPGSARGPVHRAVPLVAKTLLKDVRSHRQARAFRVDPEGPWRDHDLDFVWQRHDLFHTAGLDLARRLGRPSVLFVPATTVWEAERWGTHRPVWGPLLERVGERPALGRADLVACGSPEVAEQVVRLGVAPERTIVTPTGVDLDLFTDAEADRAAERERLGLTDRFVVGWVGSFRPFHAIERAIDAVEGLPDASLLLVGDGPERPAIEALARSRGVHAVFTGTVGHDRLPAHLAAMDVGLVLAATGGAFHYSPLKLAEYLAAGLAVVAPSVGPVSSRITDGVDALLVPPGDAPALAAAVRRLHDHPALRGRIATTGRAAARAHWSWDEQVRRVLDALRQQSRPEQPEASRPIS